MLEFDREKGNMVWKVVYYGPALSGKTTNLLSLHDNLAPAKRGQMMQLDTKQDRTLFFDLLPIAYIGESGAMLKIKIFTVPGQSQYNATRKSVLMRADGVVFVADSQLSQTLHNSQSFSNLEDNFLQVGLSFDEIPLVVQFNKRDLPSKMIVGEDEVRAKWEPTGIPLFFASALYGYGVVETFESIVRDVFDSMEEKHRISERYGLRKDAFLEYLREGDPRLNAVGS